MNEPTRPAQTSEPGGVQDQPKHKPTPGASVRLLLLLLCIVGGAVCGICGDLLSAAVFAAPTAGLFAYCYLLTFSPLVLAAPVISAVAAIAATGNFYHGLQALLYLPLAVSVCLSLFRARTKTQTVIRGAIAVGISALVLFLISYMMTYGTVAPSALRTSYIEFFENMRTQMTDSMIAGYEAMEEAAAQMPSGDSALSHPIIDGAQTDAVTDASDAEKHSAATIAYIRAMVDLSVNSVKLAMPAIAAIAAQVISYIAVSLYAGLTRLFRTMKMRPRVFRITVSRTAAVIFVIAYLINFFPIGGSISMIQIASANMATLLMPGVFLMGLRSLANRAKDPLRRRSFILTAVVLGVLVFVYPSYAIFFILIDGIGEIFFGGRSIF